MRKRIIAGNWKMNKTVVEAIQLAEEIKEKYNKFDVDVVLCPPYPDLYAVHQVIKDTPVALGAQNVYWEDMGAFTGEVCAHMLKAVGCQFVIIGHSERRQFFNETDETVNKRVKKALSVGLTPIICVGEVLKERESGITDQVVEKQVRGALAGISKEEAATIVIAYEPVWAIGTGKVATPEQAQQVHKMIRTLLASMYDKKFADSIRIQYGGSMKAENAKELLQQPDIDGGLIGGASLKADSFLGIVNA
ncbi:MAG TPA: triose-phosphate isomerase [bacterium]|nr:triose-phosphate isomerase [bacterium]HPN44541.1 triose-phosphate isomerase [bacterium]